ncbi:glycoside hydrolase family 55 protein [Hyella patelloides]|uniref:glycoside hydrolase family 55 protein n=1 Tax=Hyella patelloides TaxID=1982969 RepID=UPI001643CFDF|nr:glycoside hydrolase family 55 protein [Hyella patelloides]
MASCSYVVQAEKKESLSSIATAEVLATDNNQNKVSLEQNQSVKLARSLGEVSSTGSLVKNFPDDIGWVDIKRDYGAKGDGITDDTPAIRKALAEANASYNEPTLIYFPEGTYLVSDTLEWSSKGQSCCVSFQGQGKDRTIIKLKDSSPGFDSVEQAKAVIRTRAGNVAFRHYIRDLTVNTGIGNSGAIGIDYIANNRGAIEDVNIESGDGAGITGLSMIREWPGPSLVKNVSIDGFKRGIRTFHSVYSVTLENITLRNQTFAGIQNTSNALAIRNLQSNNSVPAIKNRGSGLVIVLDGNFQGGSPKVSAIDNTAQVYARNIQAQGYRSAIKHWDETLPALSYDEYISAPVASLFESPAHSLNLPIEETPAFHDNNLDNWASVRDYPSIQAAMNSGKSTIYFPTGNYSLEEKISIPATVRKIIGFESKLGVPKDKQAILKIEEDSPHPLILEGFLVNERITIDHASPRTLAIEHSKLQSSIHNAPNSGKLFLEDVQNILQLEHPQNVWARQLNSETLKEPQTKVINNGGNFWILGLKTEGKGSVMETNNGGKTELLGTLVYPVREFAPTEKKQAAFVNNESSQSLIYKLQVSGKNRNYPIQIKETRQGKTKFLHSKELSEKIITLFAGYQAE